MISQLGGTVLRFKAKIDFFMDIDFEQKVVQPGPTRTSSPAPPAPLRAGAAVWKCLNLIGRTPKILFSYSSKMQLPLLWLAGKSELTVGELLIGAGETLRDDTQGTQRLSRDSR